MTKVTILGQEPNQKRKKKPIQFKTFVTADGDVYSANNIPSDYKNIELVMSGPSQDFMFAYNEDRSSGVLYIGLFNDGVVE